jgi:hypothetical protein
LPVDLTTGLSTPPVGMMIGLSAQMFSARSRVRAEELSA